MRATSHVRAAYRVLALLSAMAHAGCSTRTSGPQEFLLSTEAEMAERVPDAQSRSARTWYVEKTPTLGAYLVELDGLSPLERRPSGLRIFVLSGLMRLRVGGEERVLGAGGYASIPPRLPYRLLREGRRRPRYIVFLTPDSVERTVIEGAGPLPRPARSH
ncbi:MAG: hypothetical protein AAB268_02030 [Elusimicrobiota bacterium]